MMVIMMMVVMMIIVVMVMFVVMVVRYVVHQFRRTSCVYSDERPASKTSEQWILI